MNEELNNLKLQIENLQRENERLKKELKVYELSINDHESLEEFFRDEYIVEHQKILQLRIEDLDKKILNLNFDISQINDEMNRLDNYLNEEKEVQAFIDEKQSELDNLQLLKQEKETKLEEVTKEYTSRKSTLKNATLGYYNAILKSLIEPIDHELVNNNIKFVIEQLDQCLYTMILDCRNLSFKYNNASQECENVTEMYQSLNTEIENKKKIFEQAGNFRSVEEYKLEIIDIHNEISQLEDLKQELIDTFADVKLKNCEQIISLIKYQKLMNKSNEQIAQTIKEKLDELYVNLRSQDTLKNIKLAKQIEISQLKRECQNYLPLLDEYNRLLAKEEQMHKAYLEAGTSFDDLLDYIEQANLAIDENSMYNAIVKKYQQLKEKEVNLTAQFNIVSNVVSEQIALKQVNLESGTADSNLKEINEKLVSANLEKQRLSDELRKTRDEILVIDKDPSLLNLISVLREKEFASSHLPIIHASLRTLKVELVTIKQKIGDVVYQLDKYKPLLKRIEELENEINN